MFDLEAYAVVEALGRWERYLLTVPVVVLSDHEGLLALFSDAPQTRGRRARWLEKLMPFDVEVRHVAGDSLEAALPDYLSRYPGATKEAAWCA